MSFVVDVAFFVIFADSAASEDFLAVTLALAPLFRLLVDTEDLTAVFFVDSPSVDLMVN